MGDMGEWHRRFLGLAQYISQWSKDPSTKTGAVITNGDKRIIAVGYNGFPAGIKDTESLLTNREEKLRRIVHCEMNAMLYARRDLTGCTLYTYPDMSCSRCAIHVIQAGIARAVYPAGGKMREKWADDMALAERLFDEAGVLRTTI